MALINEVVKLRECENLMKQGKIRPEVYQSLVDDVIRKRAEKSKSKAPTGGPQLLNTLKGVITTDVSEIRKSRKQSRVREKKVQAVTPSKRKTIVLEDQLLRLGMGKFGQPKWRKVHVILYEDALEYYIRNKKGIIKNRKVIQLNESFFVNGQPTKNNIRTADDDDDDEDENEANGSGLHHIFNQPNLFLISDLEEKYYFAAEDGVKKEFWVSMMVQTLRDLSNKKQGVSIGAENLSPVSLGRNYKTLKKRHYDAQVRKTVKIGGLSDLTEENFTKHEEKWKRQGEAMARRSIAMEWKKNELEKARDALKQQENLKQQLADKEEALQQVQKRLEANDQEWQQKYDELMVRMREEARERNDKKKDEVVRLQKQIKAAKRMSVLVNGSRDGFASEIGEDGEKIAEFERQIEIYKTKLQALQAALNVDVENLDWDGTLIDAENKMKELVQDLMSPDEKVQREAQVMFDQWDNIIRNHADFKNREVKKWESWENENMEKNRDALNEMRRKYVPKEFLQGCSLKFLQENMNMKRKTAERVFKNKIFKFYWMDPDRISKIHAADLTNNYACQGLDIRELRAVYATLPTGFQNDNDGRKKDFRDNIRNRLFELTRKETAGTLTSSEAMNNAYRDKAVKDKRKIAGGGGKRPPARKPQVKKNMQNKALALQALLEGRGGGPPSGSSNKSKARPGVKKVTKAATASGSGAKFDPKDPQWVTYFRMKTAGLPDGAIMNRMQKDGKDPNLWFKLVEAESETKSRSDSFNASFSMKGPEAAKANFKEAGGVKTDDLKNALSGGLKKTRSRSNQHSNVSRTTSRKEHVSKGRHSKAHDQSRTKQRSGRDNKSKSKNVKVRKTTKPKQTGTHLLTGNADDLVKKAKIDFQGTVGGANHGNAVADLEYGAAGSKLHRGSKKGEMKVGNEIDQKIQQLVDIIVTHGYVDEAEDGIKTIRFGDLFKEYELISDMLVGLLMKAKRQGLIKYRGDMLFKGIHDEIKITVVR